MARYPIRYSLVLALLVAAGCGKDEPAGSEIGPAGGIVNGPDGVTLVVPAGALAQPTRIAITRASGVADNFLAVSPAYRFEPAGLTFQQPAVLVIPFQAMLVQGAVTDVAIWWGASPTTRWAPLPGDVNLTLGTVAAEITHFSYGAAGEVDPGCVPDCAGRSCGFDGCSGTCSPGCPDPLQPCNEATGLCECIPDCTGRECGSDGCDGTCGAGCGTGTCNEEAGVCVACGNGVCDPLETPAVCPADCPGTSKVDLLVIVDNSGSMAAEQAMLQTQFEALLTTLTSALGQAPDLHVGVTSTDLGTAPFPITYCEEPYGDAGELLRNACYNPQGVQNYIIDVEPSGCTVTHSGEGACSDHDCVQTDCDSIEPGSVLATDAGGCPRCRNYLDQVLPQVFSCLAGLGTTGCGFEQQLEAMYQALNQNPANEGFLRDDAVLAVLFITDEDDCSAKDGSLYDNTQTLIDSPLGPLTSFRCFEFGITCEPTDSRTAQGERTDCVPRDDAGALLHPISRYTDFLTSLRDPGRLVVAAIAGPTNGNSVTVGLDEYTQPELLPSCSSAAGDAVPGIRMSAFVSSVTPPADQSGAYTSICESSFTTALESLGARIAVQMQ
jgi:hypothetical protein